ncbi:MAG TPA: hypothetical protein DCM08_03725 [Microscillaceae bacterium]|jgi:sulfite exporter TauE/SafE|nr:hypothetical protein [Microscillaceae bacterium]
MWLLYSAFIVGFLGSFHCVGMCGPIALALPRVHQGKLQLLKNRLFYNFGRILTYSFIGLLVGLLGRGVSLLLSQQWVSIGVGAGLLLVWWLPPQATQRWSVLKPLGQLTNWMKQQFKPFFRSKSVWATFAIGLLNGFLPCGLVYLAMAGAVATGEVGEAVLYMAFFGMGTLPAMLAVSMAGQWLKPVWQQKIYKVVPAFAMLLALLLIIRGLNLGIPYLSPQTVPTKEAKINAVHCH